MTHVKFHSHLQVYFIKPEHYRRASPLVDMRPGEDGRSLGTALLHHTIEDHEKGCQFPLRITIVLSD